MVGGEKKKNLKEVGGYIPGGSNSPEVLVVGLSSDVLPVVPGPEPAGSLLAEVAAVVPLEVVVSGTESSPAAMLLELGLGLFSSPDNMFFTADPIPAHEVLIISSGRLLRKAERYPFLVGLH
jgi:hypothetical protein